VLWLVHTAAPTRTIQVGGVNKPLDEFPQDFLQLLVELFPFFCFNEYYGTQLWLSYKTDTLEMQVCARKIASLCVQRLRFVPPWLTSRYTDMKTAF